MSVTELNTLYALLNLTLLTVSHRVIPIYIFTLTETNVQRTVSNCSEYKQLSKDLNQGLT